MKQEVKQVYINHLRHVLSNLKDQLTSHERHCQDKNCHVHKSLKIRIERVRDKLEEVRQA